MGIKKRFAALAATGFLGASLVAVGAASPAQAASDPRCVGSADALLGTMCVHIHNLATDQYYWFGPWTECRKVSIEWYDVVTYVKSNQTGGVQSTYYDPQGVSLGSKPAYYNGRPPGYKSNDESKTAAIQVCPA